MLEKSIQNSTGLAAEYKEESVKVPAVITILLLILIVIPLSFWIYRIDTAGKDSSNISKYEKLVTDVDKDVQAVSAILSSDTREMQAIQASRKAGTVRLIVPEVVIVEKRKPQKPVQSALEIELDGIYWSPANPLVTIDGETYRVGDNVRGHTIVEIGKRSVTFKGKDGKLVEKDMYENLLQNR